MNSKFVLCIDSHVSLSSTVNIIACNNMISTFKNVKNGSSSPTSAWVSYAEFAILNACNAFLESISSWISTSSIIKFSKGLGHVFLSICRCHMYGHINTAMNGLRLTSSVNRYCRKSFMFAKNIILFFKLFELNFRLVFFVKHRLIK